MRPTCFSPPPTRRVRWGSAPCANALSTTGKTTEAISYAAKAYALDGNNTLHARLLAELYVTQKRCGEAEQLRQAMRKQGPETAASGV